MIATATLGAVLRRDEKAGGFVVEHIYKYDPDLPDLAPPLARPDSLVKEGETIVSIDGQSLLNVTDERELLRGKAGQQVMLRVKPATGEVRDVLVKPISESDDARMRYAEWEYTRRVQVDSISKGAIGYVHLQAMGQTISTSGRAIISRSSIARGSLSMYATTRAATSIRGCWATCCARLGSTGSRASAIPLGTCSTRFAAISWFSATRGRHRTANPSPKVSSASS